MDEMETRRKQVAMEGQRAEPGQENREEVVSGDLLQSVLMQMQSNLEKMTDGIVSKLDAMDARIDSMEDSIQKLMVKANEIEHGGKKQ